uniref:GYF domain-containing protein n=1 Tax=Setaria digitata TaxID=48799 RepID=A0A915PNE7_9BILA
MDPSRDGLNTPKWFYQGEDHRVYGPYSSVEMQKWCKTGYFTDTMLIRTKNEDRFHTLAEWTRYSNGQSPFLLLVNSFDQLVNMSMQMQMSQLILTPGRVPVNSGPYLMMPQAAATAAPSPVPGFPPAPGFIAYHQNPLVVAPPVPSFAPHQAFSQPPSEPVDEVPSSASNTPDDSDAGWNMNTLQNAALLPLQEKFTDTYDASWNLSRDIGTDPEHPGCCDASTQTSPRRISAEQAVRLLSELIGIQLEIES